MEIELDFKASVLNDILYSLSLLENKELFDQELSKISPSIQDKNVEKYIQNLNKNKKIDRKKLNFYFHAFYFAGEYYELSDCIGAYYSKEISKRTVEEYLANLRNNSENDVLKKIVFFLTYHKEKENFAALKKYDGIHEDKDKIFELIKDCDMPNETKWNIFMIISEPKKYINEFCELIEDFLPTFNKCFAKLKPLIDNFNNHISNKIKNDGIEYLKTLPSFENINEFKKVIVSTMAVNYPSLIINDIDDILYIFIGMSFEKVSDILNGKGNEEILLNLLKTISDSSRFTILKALKNEELFGIELAEKLNLSNATISHHIALLTISDLISFDKRDGKAYYKLKKETLRNMINTIIKEFDL